jgi:hypothetical protein
MKENPKILLFYTNQPPFLVKQFACEIHQCVATSGSCLLRLSFLTRLIFSTRRCGVGWYIRGLFSSSCSC